MSAEELEPTDYLNPFAARMADVGFRLQAIGVTLVSDAEIVESRERDARRKREQYDRDQARAKKRRQRDNKRLLAAQTESSTPARDEDAA